MSNPVLDAALKYATRGWPVFPCSPANKQPLIEHGFKNASLDPEQITKWWRTWPKAMIGVPTGKVSGIATLDVDMKKGKNGKASLAALLNGDEMPVTLMAVTPTGGFHHHFAYPDGAEIRSSSNTIGPGLDVRAKGGYVIMPPSVMSDGKAYTWLSLVPLIAMPQYLLNRIAALREPRQTHAATAARAIDNPSDEVELAKLALAALPNDYGYDDWIRIGMAARQGGVGFEDFDRWSRKWSGYSEADTVRAWNSFRDIHSIGVGTLFREADNWAPGWRPRRQRLQSSVAEQARRLLRENARQRIEHARTYRCSHGQ